MKPISGAIAVAAGFVATLGIFAGGAGTAAYLIAIEPDKRPGPAVDVADLWTAKPRTVGPAAQNLDRLPPRAASALATPADAPAPVETVAAPLQVADASDTGAKPVAPDASPPIDLLSQHVAWCFDRYRSYRTEDDSYTSYAGGRRPCISPYTGELVAWANQASPDLMTGYADDPAAARAADLEARFQHAMQDDTLGDPIVRGNDAGEIVYASADAGLGLPEEHVRYCFDRYRSYRPEDNSYQPYGGGPRRQCR